MNRNGIILAVTVAALALPAELLAQQNCKGSNNRYTRSAGLYLDRARTNPRPEDKQELFRQALEVTLEGTREDPQNPRVWFMAGQAYARMNDFARADSMWDRLEQMCAQYEGLQTERHNAWVQAYNAGVTASQQGRVDDAIEAMKRADLIYQGRPEARLNLGAFYANKGQHAEAIEAFRSSLEVLRSPAREQLDEKQQAQWREHEEIAVFNVAQLLALAGRDEEAVQAYRDFLAREPNHLTALQNLGVVLARQGKRAEAAEIYSQLLDRSDLSDQDYFGIGVGLLAAEQHERAAAAFMKSLEANPHRRDAYYNLAQTRYGPSLKLEEQRSSATGAAQRQIDEQLRPLYEGMVQAAEKAVVYDPQNANIYLLIARGYRGLADITADTKQAEAHRLKAAAALEKQRGLPFEVEDVAMVAGEAETTLRGRVENLRARTGTPVRLRVSILAADGSTLESAEVTLTLPGEKETVPFEHTFAVPGANAAGWKYEVIG